MNKEIKEILNKLEIVARKHTIEVCENGSKIETMPASVVDELRLNNYSAKLLLDYITNLEQEIDKLSEYNMHLIKEIKDYEELLLEKQNIINLTREMLYKRELDDYDTYTANVICDIQSDFEEIFRGEY